MNLILSGREGETGEDSAKIKTGESFPTGISGAKTSVNLTARAELRQQQPPAGTPRTTFDFRSCSGLFPGHVLFKNRLAWHVLALLIFNHST